jgi:hypothetical protein
MVEYSINDLTLAYAKDVENPDLNYNLGVAFFNEGHAPSALNFFLRTAELTDETDLVYSSLLYCAMCLSSLGERPHSVKGFLLHAISVCPERPEAWYMYVKMYEENRDWQECLSNSISCLRNCEFENRPLSGTGYRGSFNFLLTKMTSAYFVGRFEESKSALIEIANGHWHDLNYDERQIVKSYIALLNLAPEWMKKIINC